MNRGIDVIYKSQSKSPKTNPYINNTNAAYHDTQQPGWTRNCIEAKAQIVLFCKRLRHLNVSMSCWLKPSNLDKNINVGYHPETVQDWKSRAYWEYWPEPRLHLCQVIVLLMQSGRAGKSLSVWDTKMSLFFSKTKKQVIKINYCTSRRSSATRVRCCLHTAYPRHFRSRPQTRGQAATSWIPWSWVESHHRTRRGAAADGGSHLFDNLTWPRTRTRW